MTKSLPRIWSRFFVIFFGFLALSNVNAAALPALIPRESNCTCGYKSIRKEWSALTWTEKLEYIDAVLCLQNSPSKLPPGLVDGAKSRYDDFIATHINQTLSIHLSGIFLSWHREFVWLYEKALRDECGYEGAQPYWDWPRWANNLAASPLFDGSNTSLSGDGAYNASQGPYPVAGGVLPRGTGGGCVLSGPFKTHVISFGPYSFAQVFTGTLPPNWELYTPHCFVRDLNNVVAQTYVSATDVATLMSMPNITAFQGYLSGVGVTTLGPHGGGHFTLGLALQDFFASPGDPAFFFHHSQIDRLWTEWQAIDPATRQYALNGSSTIFYAPLTPDVTLDTVQNWGYLGHPKTTKELMDVEAGDYCYEYL